MASARTESTAETLIAIEDQWGAHNYHPLDIVVSAPRACGCTTSRASAIWIASARIRP